ncbi:MAG TPA: mechanosensitive ion channel family protein [Thermoanaerobaculia bacterium]|nr:mechanosensitive ion channel family protein [Thermoanaerobaculia bacterium]
MSTPQWLLAVVYGLGVLVALEFSYILLRRSLPRFRHRFVYHLWALAVAAVAFLVRTPDAGTYLWRLAVAVALFLTAAILFALLEAAVLLRPWHPARGPMLPQLWRDALRVLVLAAVAFLLAMQVFGAEPRAIALPGTAVLAALGFALQDVLRNVFAGMALQSDHSFQSGDWLWLDGRPAQIIDITWRAVRLRTNEGETLLEPNSAIATARITNLGSGREPVAFTFRVGLPYEAPPAKVKAALFGAARSAPGAAESPVPEVFLESYGDSAITYRLRVWTRQVASISRFLDAVNTRIWYALQREGIPIPFPIRTLHFHQRDRDIARERAGEREHIADLLAHLPLFQALDRAALERLAVAARRQHFDQREVLVREGEHGDSLFVVESGQVEVSKAAWGVGAKPVALAELGPGEFFGEMSLLTGAPRSATVSAGQSSEVVVITRQALQPLLAADPDLVRTLATALAERAAETEAKIEDRRAEARATAPEVATFLTRIRSFFKLPEG